MFNFFKRKPQKVELWTDFKGIPNSDKIVKDKALSLTPSLIYALADDTSSLLEETRGLSPEKRSEFFFEMALFYLHFTDRLAFQYLNASHREIFGDALCECSYKQLFKLPEDEDIANQILTAFAETYNDRQEEYGKYKTISAQDGQSLRGTLSWEFGKKMAAIVGKPTDVIFITQVISTTSSFVALDLPGLFTDTK